ncbi:flagellar biosynthesis protein FlhB [Novilysobacter defluvii]|uniref:Flagellar biosynthetic protein FlhB n=1 Tax=Lysobacter defluvii IMMIB APB-9 = DSM 18482 TaxID=1385515 RepID=A0A0A0M4S1_9GAMM|nr:flagellar biosynthesis protein FlhB [Lysobacter defluvii]KGO98095.1 flagellar biosynthesis protein FlhB [Lysobacter defluvii IMMIB APB-9 = DSM 18482]
MSQDSGQDRTEEPTEKRLREAREKGDVPRSRELANLAVLGMTALAMLAMASSIGSAAQGWLRGALTFEPGLLGNPDQLAGHFARLLAGLMVPFLPVLGVALLACLVSPAVMGGLRWASKSLQPDFKRLNPASGLKRIYGKEGFAELLRSLLRVVLVAGVGALVISGAMSKLLAIPRMSLEGAIGTGLDVAAMTLVSIVGSLALLAAIDVPWQKFQHRSKLKMTKQEVRDELKQTEGNPELKARMRQVARQMSQRRMMEAVPTADVVVMNPTHYAVALKYDSGTMRAPRVVAKGVDEMALRIRELATSHRVAVVEAPPLARALYRQAQVDQEIPVKLYAAVAQVLSYVYQLRHWSPGRGDAPRLQQPDLGADGAPDADAPEAGR